MLLMGIDPGSVSGAFALIETRSHSEPVTVILVNDLPVVDSMVDGAELSRIVRHHKPDAALIEAVSAMPKQGARSGFRFGMGVGITHGVMLGNEVPLHLVTPQKWKRFYSLTADKERSRALAIRMFPDVVGLHRKKDHGRAEALLLAHYLHAVFLR